MSVGGIRGGGGGRRAGGTKGASGKSGAGKASGAGFGGRVGKADRASGTQGASGLVGSANVGGVDPVSAQALELARKLKSGEIKSREEATRKLVADILKEKLRMQSKALTDKIARDLEDDPRLNQTLERLWNRG